ncbi:MAG: hypothetical protein GF344_20960 [Chitinivibrionales bacterium]|nr:hypothetical protein [Chitinivibrionales bacterium]MBD3359064.1 hypothetical protein [Chitinivibrionales bacterium]
MAQREIRGCLPEGLRKSAGGRHRSGSLFPLLQPRATTSIAARPHARTGLCRKEGSSPRRQLRTAVGGHIPDTFPHTPFEDYLFSYQTEETKILPATYLKKPVFLSNEWGPPQGTPKRSEISYWNGEIKWLSSGEVRDVIIHNTKERISVEGLQNSSAKLWPQYTTVVAMYGATAGQVCLLANEMSANQACCALIPKDRFVCYTFLAARRSIQSLSEKASGSAQQNLNKGIVQNHSIAKPSYEVALQFEKGVKYLIQKWIQNEAESAALAETRDALLPKLLSGEMELEKLDGVAG